MAISTKWPAARLRGPDVAPELALEFIRRTDGALVGESFTNNKLFEAQLEELLGMREHQNPDADFSERWKRRQAFSEAFGYVHLEHLSSSWVASAWIGGPDGPVSPTGKVLLAKNFGKWPSVEEIESDLKIIAAEFPWLTFDLSVWGHMEEGDDGLPSNSWRVEAGKWEAVEPKTLSVSEPDRITSFFSSMHNPMREQTWTVTQIEKMWGDKIKEAREWAQKVSA